MPNLCPGEYPLYNLNLLGLSPNDFMPSLKHITSSTKIDLRLLACIHVKPSECAKHSSKNPIAQKLCGLDSELYAHIYFKEKLASADIKHHLIVFVKGSINISSIKIRLKKTLKFLQISKEKSFFHIVKGLAMASGTVVNKPNVYKNEQSECDDTLKKCSNFNYGYKGAEQICKIYSASIGKDYSIKFSGSNPVILTLV